MVKELGQEETRFILDKYGPAFVGHKQDVPRELWKKLQPEKYLNRIVICTGALGPVATVLQENIPRYQDVSLRLVERELFQTLLYHEKRELAMQRSGFNIMELKQRMLEAYQESDACCPNFQEFLRAFRRQYGYKRGKDEDILRELIAHFITEAVLFANLPMVIFANSKRAENEQNISPEIVQVIINFIAEFRLVTDEQTKILRRLAQPAGAAREKKKATLLSIFDFTKRKDLIGHIQESLREDIGKGDRGSELLYDPDEQGVAVISAQEDGILAGLEIAKLVFKTHDRDLEVVVLAKEGDELHKGKEILRVSGRTRSILASRRVALNYLMHLSGIASLTAAFVEQIRGTDAQILDTRKTTPGWRAMEKYAVRIGGGLNHRMSLDEMIMIKKEDISARGGIANAVSRIRSKTKRRFLEVEVENQNQVDQIIDCENHGLRVDRVLLDNMPCPIMRKAIAKIRGSAYYRANGKPTIEASGGITLRKVKRVAETGVDYISVGAITLSAPALAIHMQMLERAEVILDRIKQCQDENRYEEILDYLTSLDLTTDAEELNLLADAIIELSYMPEDRSFCKTDHFFTEVARQACIKKPELIDIFAERVTSFLEQGRLCLAIREIVNKLNGVTVKQQARHRFTALLAQRLPRKKLVRQLSQCTIGKIWDSVINLRGTEIRLLQWSPLDYYLEYKEEFIGEVKASKLDPVVLVLYVYIYDPKDMHHGAGTEVMRWAAMKVGAGNVIVFRDSPTRLQTEFFLSCQREEKDIFSVVEAVTSSYDEFEYDIIPDSKWQNISSPEQAEAVHQAHPDQNLFIRGRVKGESERLYCLGGVLAMGFPGSAFVGLAAFAGWTLLRYLSGFRIDLTESRERQLRDKKKEILWRQVVSCEGFLTKLQVFVERNFVRERITPKFKDRTITCLVIANELLPILKGCNRTVYDRVEPLSPAFAEYMLGLDDQTTDLELAIKAAEDMAMTSYKWNRDQLQEEMDRKEARIFFTPEGYQGYLSFGEGQEIEEIPDLWGIGLDAVRKYLRAKKTSQAGEGLEPEKEDIEAEEDKRLARFFSGFERVMDSPPSLNILKRSLRIDSQEVLRRIMRVNLQRLAAGREDQPLLIAEEKATTEVGRRNLQKAKQEQMKQGSAEHIILCVVVNKAHMRIKEFLESVDSFESLLSDYAEGSAVKDEQPKKTAAELLAERIKLLAKRAEMLKTARTALSVVRLALDRFTEQGIFFKTDKYIATARGRAFMYCTGDKLFASSHFIDPKGKDAPVEVRMVGGHESSFWSEVRILEMLVLTMLDLCYVDTEIIKEIQLRLFGKECYHLIPDQRYKTVKQTEAVLADQAKSAEEVLLALKGSLQECDKAEKPHIIQIIGAIGSARAENFLISLVMANLDPVEVDTAAEALKNFPTRAAAFAREMARRSQTKRKVSQSMQILGKPEQTASAVFLPLPSLHLAIFALILLALYLKTVYEFLRPFLRPVLDPIGDRFPTQPEKCPPSNYEPIRNQFERWFARRNSADSGEKTKTTLKSSKLPKTPIGISRADARIFKLARYYKLFSELIEKYRNTHEGELPTQEQVGKHLDTDQALVGKWQHRINQSGLFPTIIRTRMVVSRKRRKHVTDAQIEEAFAQFQRPPTQGQVAVALGVSKGAIQRRLKQPQMSHLVTSGEKRQKAAARHVDSAEFSKVIEQYQGVPAEDLPSLGSLAKILGISRSNVYGMIIKINMEKLAGLEPLFRTKGTPLVLTQKIGRASKIELPGAAYSRLEKAIKYACAHIKQALKDEDKMKALAKKQRHKSVVATKRILKVSCRVLTGLLANGAFFTTSNLISTARGLTLSYCSGDKFYLHQGVLGPRPVNKQDAQQLAELLCLTLFEALSLPPDFIKELQTNLFGPETSYCAIDTKYKETAHKSSLEWRMVNELLPAELAGWDRARAQALPIDVARLSQEYTTMMQRYHHDVRRTSKKAVGVICKYEERILEEEDKTILEASLQAVQELGAKADDIIVQSVLVFLHLVLEEFDQAEQLAGQINKKDKLHSEAKRLTDETMRAIQAIRDMNRAHFLDELELAYTGAVAYRARDALKRVLKKHYDQKASEVKTRKRPEPVTQSSVSVSAGPKNWKRGGRSVDQLLGDFAITHDPLTAQKIIARARKGDRAALGALNSLAKAGVQEAIRLAVKKGLTVDTTRAISPVPLLVIHKDILALTAADSSPPWLRLIFFAFVVAIVVYYFLPGAFKEFLPRPMQLATVTPDAGLFNMPDRSVAKDEPWKFFAQKNNGSENSGLGRLIPKEILDRLCDNYTAAYDEVMGYLRKEGLSAQDREHYMAKKELLCESAEAVTRMDTEESGERLGVIEDLIGIMIDVLRVRNGRLPRAYDKEQVSVEMCEQLLLAWPKLVEDQSRFIFDTAFKGALGIAERMWESVKEQADAFANMALLPHTKVFWVDLNEGHTTDGPSEPKNERFPGTGLSDNQKGTASVFAFFGLGLTGIDWNVVILIALAILTIKTVSRLNRRTELEPIGELSPQKNKGLSRKIILTGIILALLLAKLAYGQGADVEEEVIERGTDAFEQIYDSLNKLWWFLWRAMLAAVVVFVV
ncbi:MAG: carboxylating nicotinate-nucleotide diphosphorylase, partial [Candidatus Omnitrophica bacterium]|nr:carboxylating nicotinate-nucleotide diphosphorylase [Candidatus Omnitrophota bacterium]